MRGLKGSDQVSASSKKRAVLRIIQSPLLTLVAVGIVVSGFYFIYKDRAISFILDEEVMQFVLLLISFSVIYSIPGIIDLIPEYRRKYRAVGLTLSIGIILLTCWLFLSFRKILFLLFYEGVLSLDAVIQGVLNFLKSFLSLLLPFITVLIAAKYIDHGEKIPYPSLIQMIVIFIVFFRSLSVARTSCFLPHFPVFCISSSFSRFQPPLSGYSFSQQ